MDPLLKSIPIFSSIESDEAPELLKLLNPVTLEAGQVLFREKTVGDSMWVLGPRTEVSISATPPQNKRPVVIAKAGEGETVGEMALIDAGPRSATAVVTHAGPAHRVDAAGFSALRGAFHPVAYKILRQICKELCSRLRATSERIAPSSRQAGEASSVVVAQRHATAAEIDEFAPFHALPQVVKLALSQKLRPVHTDFGEALFSEGDQGDSAYFLVAGEVRVERNGQVLATLQPGAMFGLISVIDRGRRSASCVTSGPVRLLQLSKADFDSLFLSGNRFAFQIVDLASRQLVAHLRTANELVRGTGRAAAGSGAPAGSNAAAAGSDDEVVPLELELEIELAADSGART
jgi:CRP-like cAMP-binding protein